MPTQVPCPSCKQPLRVPDELVGQDVKCPKCATEFVAEAASESPAAESRAPSRARQEAIREERDSPYAPARDDRDSDRPARRRLEDFDDDLDDDDDDFRPRRRRRSYAPHRGGLILTFGIIGLVVLLFCWLPAFSIPAWIMGHIDLKAMREGRMDPDGRGPTMAGYIMGIVGTALFVIGIVILIVALVFG